MATSNLPSGDQKWYYTLPDGRLSKTRRADDEADVTVLDDETRIIRGANHSRSLIQEGSENGE